VSCPYSRRGHKWIPHATLPPHVVLCARCGSLGRIARDGSSRTVWEPEPCGALHVSATSSFHCGFPQDHDGECAPGLRDLEPTSPLRGEHACDVPKVREVVLRLQQLVRTGPDTLTPEEYLRARAEIVRELVSLLV
jgi:hypothetical protein